MTELRKCDCRGSRPLVQGTDRRTTSNSGQILTFCRRCNGLVTNQHEIALFVEPATATALREENAN